MDKQEENLMNFQFLVPSKDAEKIDVYCDALNKALEHEEVKNIAISGSYGAGKSSFLKTFETKNSDYNFLDISLATFKKEDKDLSLIEKSILQQIFYKVEQNDIPFSRFKRIHKINWLKLKTILVLLSIVSLLVFFDSKYISSEVINNIFIKSIAIIILMISGFVFIKSIIKNLTGITLDKLNLQNLEITTNKEEESSLLNKYLDEIIYFFSETKYNVVVFQDLDRFDNIDIFTKSREINTFLNNSEQIKQQDKKIVFLYAIKDEMFKNDDSRTKFFDFMIPIIPYVNSSTSYDKLLEFFDADLENKEKFYDDEKEEFQEFLRDIALYITDMRLLKNIYNEYKIYDENIGEKLDKVKLLAMMVYKNFYPEDFSLLHKDQGDVFLAFKEKNTHIQDLDASYNKKLKNLMNEVSTIENEVLQTVQELRKIYIYSIISKLQGNLPYLRVDTQNIPITDAVNDNMFKVIKNSNLITHPNNSNINTTFEIVENELSDLSYDEREELILKKSNSSLQDLNNQIQDIKNKQKPLKTKTLSQLYKELNKKEEEEDKKLLYSLLLKGHIDEHYHMYLSYSFDKSLTISDTEFLKSVINDIELDYDYKLTNIKELINKLKINEYAKKAILNYDLIDFIIENKEKLSSQYEEIFKQLSNSSKKSLDFIFKYLDNLPEYNKFIVEIADHRKDFWKVILSNKTLTSEQKEDFFYQLSFNLSNEQIVMLNFDNALKDYVESLTKLRDLVAEDNQRMKEIISLLNIHFYNLSEPITNIPLFAYIYENNYYVPNELMIEQVLVTRYSQKDKNKKEEITAALSTKNLSTIIEIDTDKKLIERIEDNISEYIDEIFLTIETNQQEDEETIIWLLNNENLEISQKEKIIEHEEIILDDISEIENENLYEKLFANRKIKATWENVSVFYNLTSSLTDTLLSFLNDKETATELSKIRINSKYCESHPNFKQIILREILESNDFELEAYQLYIKANGYWYQDLNICDVGEDKIDALIDGGKLQLTTSNVEKLIQCSMSKHLILIENLFDTFVDEFDELGSLLRETDFIKLLESSNLTSEQKFNLMELINIESFTIDEKVSLLISKLYQEKKVPMSYSLLNLIIPQLPKEKRFKVLLPQLELQKFTMDEISNLLANLPEPYLRLCYRIGSHIKLPKNDENLRLAKILVKRECVSSVSIKENDSNIRINRFKH